MSLTRIASLFVSLFFIAACARQPPVPPMDLQTSLPDLSARYLTERHHAHRDHEDHDQHLENSDISNEWLFWRSSNRIEVSIPRQHTGEAWLKDNKTYFYQKLFHQDHKIVEYQHEDLNALNVAVHWRTNALMIDPAVLQQLQVDDERWIDSHPALELSGTHNDIDYDVVWLVDLNIPYSLKKSDAQGNKEFTRLQDVYAGNATPLAAPDNSAYEIIDYADLGDRERDPFVIKIQHHLPGGHVHTH